MIKNNTLYSEWHITDVQSLDDTLTDKQALQVLVYVDVNHDANFGINWDSLQDGIDKVKEGTL